MPNAALTPDEGLLLACHLAAVPETPHRVPVETLERPTRPRAGLHLAQARLAIDPGARLGMARRIVDGRLRNQRALRRRLNRVKRHQEPAPWRHEERAPGSAQRHCRLHSMVSNGSCGAGSVKPAAAGGGGPQGLA